MFNMNKGIVKQSKPIRFQYLIDIGFDGYPSAHIAFTKVLHLNML